MTESRQPPMAVILSVAGLIPFLVCGWGAMSRDPSGVQINSLALITYGAVSLSFLGGVHWGFVLKGDAQPGERRRLALGVLPALTGWGAALLGITTHMVLGLAVLIAGYIATAVLEGRGHRLELVPHGYMMLRWLLTGVIVLMLAAVLVQRVGLMF